MIVQTATAVTRVHAALLNHNLMTIMKATRIALILILCFLASQTGQAQSGGTPGSQVEVVLSGEGVAWSIFTYNDGSGRVDFVTNRISVNLQIYPSPPQVNGYLFTSDSALLNGTINIMSTAIETEPGFSTTDNLSNQLSYHEPGFAVDSEFFGPEFVAFNSGDLAGLTLEPPITATGNPQPYRLFYDGTNGTLTAWIRLPPPFNYNTYPSEDEAYTISCVANVTGNGSSFSGTVQDASTIKPIPNATVTIDGRSFQTDSHGMFFVAYIPPGPLTVEISAPGYISYEKTEPLSPFSAVQVTFALTKLPVLSGHIYCSCDSNAITGASVQIGKYSAISDANGLYEVTNVLAGTYVSTISADNYAPLTASITVAPGQPVVTNDFYLTNLTLVVNPVFDSHITGDANAQTVTNAVDAAIQVYKKHLANALCVTVLFSTTTKTGDLGESDAARNAISYSNYFGDLSANPSKSTNDALALASMPPGPDTGVNDNTQVILTAANLAALGEAQLAEAAIAAKGGFYGKIYLNLANLNDLQSTVAHEINEILGIGGWGSTLELGESYVDQPSPTSGVGSLDLFRYSAPGVRSFALDNQVKAYFSIDGGKTTNVYFNQYGQGSDFGDWGDGITPADMGGNDPAQVQDAFGSGNPGMGANEFIALDVIGYTLAIVPTTIQKADHTSNTFTFVWSAMPGQPYQVEYTTNLALRGWTSLGGPATATGLSLGISDTNVASAERFYRLVSLSRPQIAPPHQGKGTAGPFVPIASGPTRHFLRSRP